MLFPPVQLKENQRTSKQKEPNIYTLHYTKIKIWVIYVLYILPIKYFDELNEVFGSSAISF
jgi:hypothetical protein